MMAAMGFVGLSGVGILSAALVATLALGKASASIRHLVWTAALAAVLAIPVLEISGLRLEVPVPAPLLEVVGTLGAGGGASAESATAGREPLGDGPVLEIAGTVTGGSVVGQAAHPSSPTSATDEAPAGADEAAGLGSGSEARAETSTRPERATAWTAGGIIVAGWALGCLVLLGMTFLGHLSAHRLTVRDVRPPSWETRRRFATFCGESGMHRPVQLLVSPRIRVPATWGLRRTTVMLPADHESWSRETLDRALLHELAHISRRDCLSYLIAEVARAVHWPNPLVWLAVRRQRSESERACDDYVLGHGASASAYAEDLVAMVKALRADAELPNAALAMAGRSGIGGRVRAILDPRQARSRVGRVTVLLACALTVGIATAISVVTPVAVAQEVPVAVPDTTVAPTEPTAPTDRTARAEAAEPMEPTAQAEPTEAVEQPRQVAPSPPVEQASPSEPSTPPEQVAPSPPTGRVAPPEQAEPAEAVPAAVSTPARSEPGPTQVADTTFQVVLSDHFEWHFDPEEAAAVEDAVRMGERWYERLARSLRHEFESTRAVLLYADPPVSQPENRVVLPLTGSYRDVDRVLGHELVHAFQHDIARSDRRAGLRGLGALPLWVVEGMAEYLSVGRDDPQTAMWMRDAVRRDDVPTVRQMTRDSRYFPYRFGHALWAYVGETYGDDAVVRIYRSALQVGFEGAVRQELGVDTETLSARWRDRVGEETLPSIQGRTAPEDAGRLLTAPSMGAGRANVSPSLSPDGRLVAFLSEADPSSVDLDIAHVRRREIIHSLPITDSDPRTEALRRIEGAGTWSPDSRFFAYAVVAEGDDQIVVVDSDDGRVTRRISFEESGIGRIADPSWSPDGRYLAFSAVDGGFSDLFLYDLAAGALVRLTEDRYVDLQPSWSPDGRTLAFTSDRGGETDFGNLTYGRLQLSLFDLGTGEVEVLPIFDDAKHVSPQYSADGNRIYFVSDPDGFSDIYEVGLGEGTVRRITNLATGVSGHTSVAPALSVSASGVAAFSVFDQREFHIYTLELAPLR